MGRGLSDLQSSILRLALAGTQRPPNVVETSLGMIDTNAHRPHVEAEEVLGECYGITREQRRAGYQWKVYRQTAEYNRAAAALSRAFSRLVARGLLAERHHRKKTIGYDLTARGLSVKSCGAQNNS